MDASFLFFLIAGAVAAGFVNGLAGFGTALFGLGFWLQILPPEQAVAVTLAVSVATGIQGLWVVRGSIDRARLLRFLLPALPGVPLGVAALSIVDASVLKLGIAAFLLLYGGFFLVNRNLPTISDRTPKIDMTIGFLGGFLGGAAGLSGALPTMWCALKDWSKAAKRGLFQPFNLTILSLSALALAFLGAYTAETMLYLAVAIPVSIVSAQIGIWIFKRISDPAFRVLLIALLFLSGLIIAGRELL